MSIISSNIIISYLLPLIYTLIYLCFLSCSIVLASIHLMVSITRDFPHIYLCYLISFSHTHIHTGFFKGLRQEFIMHKIPISITIMPLPFVLTDKVKKDNKTMKWYAIYFENRL